MYIAGLNLPVSSTRVLEAFVVFSAFDFFRHIRGIVKSIAVQAESKGGHVRVETTPFLGRVVTPIHALAAYIPPAVYIGALVLNKLRQPMWMTQFALSDKIAGVRLDPAWKGLLRVGACVAGLALRNLIDSAFHHLGEQWHSLGVRVLSDVRDSIHLTLVSAYPSSVASGLGSFKQVLMHGSVTHCIRESLLDSKKNHALTCV